MTRLRDKLLLSAAGLVCALVAIMLLAVRATTLAALRQELMGEIAASGPPVDYMQAPQMRLAHRIVGEIAYDPALNELRQRAMAQHDFTTLRDQARDVGRSAQADLLLITDVEGNVLARVRDGHDDSVRPPRNLARLPLIEQVLRTGHGAQCYAMMPDGCLYLVATGPLFKGEYTDGAVLFGKRIDAGVTRALSRATHHATVLLEADGRVLGGTQAERKAERDPSPALTRAFEAYLAAWKPPALPPPWKRRPHAAPAAVPPVEMALDGRTWLAQPHPLWNVLANGPVAWLFFMKPVDELTATVHRQSLLIAGLGGGALLLAIGMAQVLARRVTRPIEELERKMQRVGHGDLEQTAAVHGRDEVARLAITFNEMTAGLRQKELLKKFVPMGARDAIDHDGRGQVVLGGQRRRAAVLFSDLRGFTTLSERLDPAEVVAILNEYMKAMLGAIDANRGDVIDYIGDAILAVFRDHEESGSVLAVEAALQMQEALNALHEASASAEVRALRMGVGINTGMLVEGNIGTAERVKHAVVGDTVNVGSRIQDRSRDGRHTCILVSGATCDEVRDRFEVEFFGNESLKGHVATVPVWEVVARKPVNMAAT